MPSDLTSSTVGVVVRDPSGSELPFSRGLMATSILATGLETDRAYAIATEIQQALAGRGRAHIEAAELADVAHELIARRAGPAIAQRYRAWRELRRDGRPLVIVLGGAPGVGKSTVSTRLAVRLGITRIVTTDTIREVLRTVIPASVLPELHISTYETVGGEHGGAEVYLRQARVVGAAVNAVVRRLITERRSTIVEGVHLLPGELLAGLGRLDPAIRPVELMLTLANEEAHRGQLAARTVGEPGRGGQRSLDHFGAIRTMHDLLAERAQRAGVECIDLADPRALIDRVLEHVLRTASQ